MNTDLNALIVGGRGVGATHIQALSQIRGVSVVAVASSSAASARATAQRFGIERWTGDYREFVGDPGIDVVHVCTPNDLHLPVARDALAAGKHVVCEKPVAATVEDAREMTRLAEGAAGEAFLCYKYRYLPLLQRLRALVGDGVLGEVHAIRGHYLQSWALATEADGWRGDPRRAGSSPVLFDIGTHLIDLVEQVGGGPATDPLARPGAGGRKLRHADVLFQVGPIAAGIAVSQASAGSDNHLRLQVEGANASATWTFDEREHLAVMRHYAGEALNVNAFRSARHVTTTSWESVEDAAASAVALFQSVYDRIAHPEGPGLGPEAPRLSDGLRHVRFLTTATAPLGVGVAGG